MAGAGLALAGGSAACDGGPSGEAPAASAGPGEAASIAIREVVAAERAFSALSTEVGMRDAFLTYFADDVVTFGPAPTVGTEALRAGPEGPKLEWWPEYAEVSADGSMGFTTGPYVVPGPDGSPVGGGHYHSFWHRPPGGEWRVLLDIGGPHAGATEPDTVLTHVPPGGGSSGPAPEGLMDVDRRYGQAYRDEGPRAAAERWAHPRARIYRFRSAPFSSLAEALDAQEARSERLTWEPMDGRTADSGDLGYTYGTGTVTDDGAPDGREMSYARFWRRDADGQWRLVLEVVLPHPPGA